MTTSTLTTARSVGLWRELRFQTVIALVVPTVLLVLWGQLDAPPARLARTWLEALAVTLAISTAVQVGWRGLLPALGVAPRGAVGAVAHGVVVLLGAVVGGEVGAWVLHLAEGIPVEALRAGILRVGLVTALVVGVVIYGGEALRARLALAEIQAAEARRAATEAQLQALQARIHPHFLFNSLNAIAALVHDDPDEAEATVERLARVLRHALQAGQRDRVLLREELDVIRAWLEIEQVRHGDDLDVVLDADDDVLDLPVPPFVLQPLVENAVRHGIDSRPGPGVVTVRARREGGTLLLEVADDGPGPGGSTHAGQGTGLVDLRERLTLQVGPGASVVVTEVPAGFTVVVRLPLPEAP